MAISNADIEKRYSVVTGSAGNIVIGTPAGSLGDQFSLTVIPSGTLHDLFDVVTGTENAASNDDYRCIFLLNDHATLTWTDAVVWISGQTSGGATISLSVDTTGVTPKGQASAQAKTIANVDTPPATQTFTAPTTKATGLALGDIPAGSVAGIWVKRLAANTTAVSNDRAIIAYEGDSAP